MTLEAKTHLIKTMDDFTRLVEYSKKVPSEFIFVDCETNSKHEKLAKLYGKAVAFNDKRAFYIPWRTQTGNNWWSPSEEELIVNWLVESVKSKKLVNHNISYDVLVMDYNLGVDLTEYIYSDTILLKHTINEEKPFGLKELSQIEFGPDAVKAQQVMKDSVIANGGKWTKDQKDMYLADTDLLGEYAMWDVLLTCKLFHKYSKELKDQGLEDLFYKDEIMPLYKEATIPMKRSGFPVDVAHFQNLKSEIVTIMSDLEHEIHQIVEKDIEPLVQEILTKVAPVKRSGNFPKKLAEYLGVPIPLRKKKDKATGDVTLVQTLSAKDVEKQSLATPEYNFFYDWLLGKTEVLNCEPMAIEMAQRQIFFNLDKNKDQKHIFNLASNDHLGYYFFKIKQYVPVSKTGKGKEQVNAAFLEIIKDKYQDEIATKLLDLKKLGKLLSTYVNGVLDRQIDGVIYTSLLQFGTTSGRYSSQNPNLQNLPRVKDDESGLSELVLKYVNSIKKGFIAGEGYKIVNADYSQLEPCCFATVSEDKGLIDVFIRGEDLYSRIAIDVFKMTHLSADKKAPNYLKKVSPEFRGKAKIFALAVPYGAEEARISQAMSCDYKEAKTIINAYLNAYPGLKRYMYNCNASVKKYGMTKTKFGRIRHLPEAKELFDKYGNDLLDFRWARANNLVAERKLFKTCLNNSKNFPIQGLAAHIVNRATIAIARAFKAEGIVARLVMQVHDEITCIAKAEHAERAAQIVKECMENTTKIDVPLVAEPLIADSWDEAK